MAETIRDVVIRMQIKQVGGGIKPPNLGPAKLAVDDLHKSVAGLERTEKELAITNIELFDSFGQVGEGLIRVGRGMTLLGISADDDLRRVVEQLSKMQAALDIFTGGVQAVKGMVAAQKALAVATTATATAQVTLTAAALPYLAAAALVAAAIGGIVAFTVDWGDAVDDTGEKSKEANDKVIRSLQRRLSLEKELLGIQEQIGSAVDVLGTTEQKLAKATERRQKATIVAANAEEKLRIAKLKRSLVTRGRTDILPGAERLPLLTDLAEATEAARVTAEREILIRRRVSDKQATVRARLAGKATTLEAARAAEQAAFAALGEEGREGDTRAQFKARKLPGFGQAAAALQQFEENELSGRSTGAFLAVVNRAVAASEQRSQREIELLDRLIASDAEADRKLTQLLNELK